MIKEESPLNSAGSGNIAGLGVGPQGEPTVNKNRKALKKFNKFMVKRDAK